MTKKKKDVSLNLDFEDEPELDFDDEINLDFEAGYKEGDEEVAEIQKDFDDIMARKSVIEFPKDQSPENIQKARKDFEEKNKKIDERGQSEFERFKRLMLEALDTAEIREKEAKRKKKEKRANKKSQKDIKQNKNN